MPKINIDNINNNGNKIFVDLFTRLIKQVQYDSDNKDLTKKEKTVYSFKIRHLKNALRVLKLFPNKINSTEDLEDIRGIGKGTLKRIEEILKTKKLKELRNDKKIKDNNKELEIIEELISVINIGRKVAKELVKKYKVKSVKDLKEKVKEKKIELNDKILLGLKYHGKVKLKIPRKETELYIKEFEETVKNISKDLNIIVCGSYRRKKETSGDIDVLISGAKGTNKVLRNKFIKELKNRGIIIEVIASGSKKFMGIARLAPFKEYRHIDIIDTDIDQYPFAQLYFTGSGGFNSHMRLVTLKKGYSLNEYCISDKKTKKPVLLAEIRKKLGKDRFEDEKDIFKFIDLEYVTPANRNTITLSKIL